MTTARSADGAVHVAAVAQSGAGHTLGVCGAWCWVFDRGPAGPLTCPDCVAWAVANADPDTGMLPDIAGTPRPARTVGGDCTQPHGADSDGTGGTCGDHPWQVDTTGHAWCAGCGTHVASPDGPQGCTVLDALTDPFGHRAPATTTAFAGWWQTKGVTRTVVS